MFSNQFPHAHRPPAQMLNCCIERKRARDEARKAQDGNRERERKASGGASHSNSAAESGSAKEASPGKSWESWSDSEDEFFECLSDQGEADAPQAEGDKDGSKTKAEGRLHPYNNMTLLNSTEPLYVPVTQVSLSVYRIGIEEVFNSPPLDVGMSLAATKKYEERLGFQIRAFVLYLLLLFLLNLAELQMS